MATTGTDIQHNIHHTKKLHALRTMWQEKCNTKIYSQRKHGIHSVKIQTLYKQIRKHSSLLKTHQLQSPWILLETATQRNQIPNIHHIRKMAPKDICKEEGTM